jgi:hypothetical protein
MPGADRGARSEMSATALQGFPVAPLRPPPGAKPGNLAELPFDNFEPPPELLKSSGWRFGGKILKLLSKLRRKSSSGATTSRLRTAVEELDQGRVFHFQDLISHSTQFPTPLIDDVTKRYNYDSDEHSGTQNSSSSSSSTISSSSRNSNSSEFDSHRSSGTPRSPFCSGPLSNSQLMASILISIMDEEDSASASSEEHGSSEDEVHSLTGPHESAWHQPRDEMLAVDSPTGRGRQSGSSSKHLVNSGRHAPKSNTRSALAVDGRLTSPGPSRRFGKLNLSRIEAHKLR